MDYTDNEDIRFKATETGHIDTRFYLDKAQVERARAATLVMIYARDKFMGVVRCAVRVLRFKPCGPPVRG